MGIQKKRIFRGVPYVNTALTKPMTIVAYRKMAIPIGQDRKMSTYFCSLGSDPRHHFTARALCLGWVVGFPRDSPCPCPVPPRPC